MKVTTQLSTPIDALLAPDRRSHRLDDLALVHLEHRMISFADVVPKGRDFADVTPGAFYAEAVGWMVAEGITAGTTPGRRATPRGGPGRTPRRAE